MRSKKKKKNSPNSADFTKNSTLKTAFFNKICRIVFIIYGMILLEKCD